LPLMRSSRPAKPGRSWTAIGALHCGIVELVDDRVVGALGKACIASR
jgi:hypothetical protein